MGLSRSIGQAILKQIAPQGLPIDTMIAIARRGGGGYRFQDMRNDARVYTGRIKYQGAIERLSSESTVPQAWMVENELNQPQKYRVFGKATYYDTTSDQYLTKTVSFYTDDLASTGEYGYAFEDYYASQYTEDFLEFTEFKQTGLEHNRGYGY